MRLLALLALSAVFLSGCVSLREKAIAASEECKSRTFVTHVARATCYDEQERPIFIDVPELADPYNKFTARRTDLARQLDERTISADQYKVTLNENLQEFVGKFLQHEANEKARDAKRWDDARKLLATGFAAYGEAKSARAKAGLQAMEESKPKVQSRGPADFKSDYESGMNRICIYEGLDGNVAITIGLLELCPLSLD